MTVQLLHWGLFSFMIGLFLSLPLAAVYYQQSPQWTKIFTNPRKLKSAHVDFFVQAFAAAFVYLLEFAWKQPFPDYVIIPLLFGTICNPLLLLIEATPLNRAGIGKLVYMLTRATSPISLLFAWSVIAWSIFPTYLSIAFAIVVVVGALFILSYKRSR